jgi:hypothetical protein
MSRIGRRHGAGVLVLAVVAALAVSAAVFGTRVGAAPRVGAPGGPAAAVEPAGPLRWVTLLTGDRVALRPGAAAATARPDDVLVRPAAGREQVGFHRYTERGDLLVVPADVAALVAAGRLDRRLFDVTLLLRSGYDDRSRPDLPLIVGHAGGAAAAPAARARLAAGGARSGRELASIGAAAVREDKASATRFWASVRGDLGSRVAGPRVAGGVERIWLDAPARVTLDQSVPQIGAPAAWRAGFTGAGTTVAVLDTGLDATHPDLTDAVTGAQDFTDDGVDGTDDGYGHGTHVASIITGSGAASGGRYAGVAPDTKLLIGKVLDDNGFGDTSWIIAGMEWAAAQHARVVNMSLGLSFGAGADDPLVQALTRLTENGGPLFVVSAGNTGPDGGTVNSPADAAAALSVGAVSKQDELADFSSRGPTPDGAIKPEITAPGVDIVAAKAAHGQIGDAVGDAYVRLSGTSMAAPHVAGAAAILAGQHPDWTAGQLKAALVGSATPRAGVPVDAQGAGRVDVARAVSQPAYATPADLNLGIARWPHTDDPPIRRTVTYHNAGSAPVTLDLSVAMAGAGGQPAPAGMFTLSQPTVTVPAGGTTGVELTAATTEPAPDTRYTGLLTAAGGPITIRTPLSLVKEVESYDVPVRVLDRAGQPTADYNVFLLDLDQGTSYQPYDPSGVVPARLPKGHYLFAASVRTPNGPGEFDVDETLAFEPEVVVSGPTPLLADARRGKPTGIAVDRPAAPTLSAVEWRVQTAVGPRSATIFTDDFDGLFVVPSRTAAPGRFSFDVEALMARPDGTGSFTGSPYVYHVGWVQPDRVPSQLVRHLPDRDLAVVQARIAGPTPGHPGRLAGMGTGRLPLPGSVTELFSRGLQWSSGMEQYSPADDLEAFQDGAVRTFGAGPARTERWNLPVFGPGFPAGNQSVARVGDELLADLPLFSDQTPDHAGASVTDSGSTRLSRDGQLVAETPFAGFIDAAVPVEPGTYRLETAATRSAVSPLSTRLSAAWTFPSAHVAGPDLVALPVAAVRFAPNVDDRGAVPGGRRVVPVPVYLQRQAGGGFGRLARLSVAASFDDGATWRPVTLAGSGDRRVAMVPQPAGARFVSLRASAADPSGNAVEETIVRAYAVR